MVHYTYGLLKARIEIPAGAYHAELLPHQFEHIIEQIEGVDLAELSRARDSRARPGSRLDRPLPISSGAQP